MVGFWQREVFGDLSDAVDPASCIKTNAAWQVMR